MTPTNKDEPRRKRGRPRHPGTPPSRTPEYRIWCGIKTRCRSPRASTYRHYGARGIDVCERWAESFEAFYADMGPRPTRGHSIDRIDVDGDYEPGNCRWATAKEQANNTRRDKRARRARERELMSRRAAIAYAFWFDTAPTLCMAEAIFDSLRLWPTGSRNVAFSDHWSYSEFAGEKPMTDPVPAYDGDDAAWLRLAIANNRTRAHRKMEEAAKYEAELAALEQPNRRAA